MQKLPSAILVGCKAFVIIISIHEFLALLKLTPHYKSPK